ncbi:MAG: DUF2975 domain-containing protein [Sphingomonas sp.]
MSRAAPAASTVSQIILRILIILNWIYGAFVLAILVGLLAAERWTIVALGFASPGDAGPLVRGLWVIPALGLVGVPLSLIVLRRLLAIVGTVRGGDPFVAKNAARLQTIAWAVLCQQLLQLAIGIAARSVSTPEHPLHISPFSPSGWLAVVLLFVLAGVFAEGSRMRDDLAGTI